LHAGAAGKNDHDVFAKRFLIFLDAVAEASPAATMMVMEMMPQAIPTW